MDAYVSFFFKLLIGAFAFALLLGAWSVGLGLSDVSNFKQRVNYAIEQHGGLTKEAVGEIDSYAKKQLHGTYHLQSAQLEQKVAFGETVTYKVVCVFPTYLPMPKEVTETTTGAATSHVR